MSFNRLKCQPRVLRSLKSSFETVLRVKQNGHEKLLNRDFRVNIWDFGGQEVYHSTHQFFLTHRSLYLLVADDRKEDTDFNYWLTLSNCSATAVRC